MAVLTAWVECGIDGRRRTVYRSLQQSRQGNQYSAVAVKFWWCFKYGFTGTYIQRALNLLLY